MPGSSLGRALIFTPKERLQASKDWGEQKRCLTEAEQRSFASCCLCFVNPAQMAQISRYGFIYCKKCILENLLEQKKKIKEDLEFWEKQCRAIDNLKELERKKVQDKHRQMIVNQTRLIEIRSNVEENEIKSTPKKPNSRTMDPMEQKPLRMKDLYSITIGMTDGKANCLVCLKDFYSISKAKALLGCGHVCCLDCFKKFSHGRCSVCSKAISKKRGCIDVQTGELFKQTKGIPAPSFLSG